MDKDLDLKVVRLRRLEGDYKIKAFVDISISGFVVRGLRVISGKNGLFLGMPQEKAKDGKWYNAFYPLTREARQDLAQIVLGAYQE
ncbi:MAG: SpoVG family protein [Candidatus Omnitrophota bacterium]